MYLLNLLVHHKMGNPLVFLDFMAPARITDFFAKKLVRDDSLDDLPTKKRAKKEEQPTEKIGKSQTFLDLGQKVLKTCQECGMTYDPTIKEDNQRHTKFHQESRHIRVDMSGVTWREDLPDGKTLLFFDKKLQNVTQLLDQVCDRMQSAKIVFDTPYKLYMIVRGDVLLAMCLIEPCRQAYLCSDIDKIDTTKQMTCVIGISRIWVDPQARKQGLARLLLDRVRTTAAKPIVLSKKLLAFSQPTSDGFALATAYQMGIFPSEVTCLVYKS